jgi:hypothetical protein
MLEFSPHSFLGFLFLAVFHLRSFLCEAASAAPSTAAFAAHFTDQCSTRERVMFESCSNIIHIKNKKINQFYYTGLFKTG